MSRFLSRPPPSYKREDVSRIGSIKKLQNERGRSKQRMENSLEKNEMGSRKRSRGDQDKMHCLEGGINKKMCEKRVKFNASCLDASKGDPDLLERSELSEEHDPPAFVLKQCNSSESTQSSNKLPDADPNRKKQGLVIRIKLPSKKQNPEPVSRSLEPCTSFPVTKSANAQDSLPESRLQRKNIPLVQLEDRKPCTSFQVTKSANVRVSLPESYLQRKNIPLVQLEDPKPIPATEHPCFSGRVAQAPITSEDKPSKSRHSSGSRGHGGHGGHRARKSEKRFRDLILNWKDPTIQVVEADAGEQDWLVAPRQPRHEKPSAHHCRAVMPESNVFPSTEVSLQPRACYIPELDTYQLPYVIPF